MRRGGRAVVGCIGALLCTACGDPTGGHPQGECDAAHACEAACCADGEQCMAGVCVAPDRQCIYIPKPGDFEAPERAWWWPYEDADGRVRRSIEAPDFNEVMSTPVVLRAHGRAHPDEPPTVFFNSFADGGGPSAEGVLRAVRGDTGEPVWSATDPSARVNGVSSPAAGDLLGDGNIEIVTGAWDPAAGEFAGLVAFRADGTVLWRAPGLDVGWGGPAIADLDGVPPAEVLIGSTVLDGATGRVLCAGDSQSIGGNGIGPLSTAADLDGDGRLELIAGNQAWRFSRDAAGGGRCEKLWPRVRLKDGQFTRDGFPAVAQIFDDPKLPVTQGRPQVAVVTHGTVRVQDWTGGILWDPMHLPGGGLGGPPTIADFDGDGKPEIGVAGQRTYTVFKPGVGILWSMPTQELSSSVTGSSVFDFDGNGRPEVVYADECYVHVYDGATGQEVFSAPNASCTAYEMPVVADVDGTGAAGLLVPRNDICRITCPWGEHQGSGMHGLALLRSPTDAWVSTRAVWNEHTYHLTNVGDFGEVPAHEPRAWGAGAPNSVRQNYQGTGTFAAPDLRIVRTHLDGSGCPAVLHLVAEVANTGARAVRAGTPVAFYALDTSPPSLLGVVFVNQPLRPGDHATAVLDWQGPPRVNAVPVRAVAGDPGTGRLVHHECDETNNAADFGGVACHEAG
jgi:hypothetical protein